MLLEFTLKNYGPFRDEAVLSLVKDSGDEHPDNSVTCPGTDSRVLTSAAVFGLNSSGKSRVFMAIGDLIRIIGADGQRVGVGKADCDATTLRRELGCKDKKPVVHYDFLYVESSVC